jgi:hypothetical protein
MDNDDLLCYLISNPYKTNRTRRKINYVNDEIYKLIIKKYPKYIINRDDLNLIFEYLEKKLIEINRKNLINELVENTINQVIDEF